MTQTVKVAQEESDKPHVDDAPKHQKASTRSSSLDAQQQLPSVNTAQTLSQTEPKETVTHEPLDKNTITLSHSPLASPENKELTMEKQYSSDTEMETVKEESSQENNDNNETPSPPPPPPAAHPLIQQLKSQLAQQQRILDHLEVERSQYRLDVQSLNDRISQMNTKIQQRAEAQQQLETNYLEHLQSIRATPDDLTTIGQKLKDLKTKIRALADELLEQADPVTATNALRTFWLNLHDCINNMGHPLPLHRLRMLTEKFMMDVLVQNMNLNVFPGLTVLDSYNDLAFWLERYDSSGFATRLRQEIALAICKENAIPDSPIYRHLQDAIHTNFKFLFGGLCKAYPFIYQQQQTYATKIQALVTLAMDLGFAMKGQEVDVAAAETRELVQVFDPHLMIDEDGQVDGIVQFCVCPPFVVYGPTMTALEKGRVLCAKPSTALSV